MNMNTSRRGFIAGTAASVALTVPTLTLATPAPDAALEAAWNRRLEARQEYERIGVNGDTPEEMRLWAIIDAAEDEMRATVAKTPRGTMLQLWVALAHSMTSAAEDVACNSCDLAYFVGENEASQEWDARLMIAAIRSLASM
jgi:hypothetical protein